MKHVATTTSCIILAGGEGKRVDGQDKGLIVYNDKPLVESVIDIMKPQADDIIISANRNINTYQQYTDNVVSDLSSSYQGPLAGINACLAHCKHSHAVVVACDMPNLPDDLVSRLFAAIGDNDVAIATVDNYHQLAMMIKTDMSEAIQQELDKGQRKLIQWVESVAYVTVNFDDMPDAFVNLNHLQNT